MSNSNLAFPIKTATACQYKWTWSTVFLSVGTSASCHRCKGWDVSDFMEDFHNHPGKVSDREKMLEGQWPGNGCEYCKKIEDVGAKSERTAYINDMELAPPELLTNPRATKVTPRILEVYFSNVCNQKCTYCSPFFSSLIEAEVHKFGPIETEYSLDGFNAKPGYKERKDKFWQWMDKYSHHLFDFQILGGEPMYQPEFEECLVFLENKKHPNLKWKIFSNLKHDPIKFEKKLERIEKLVDSKNIKSFEIVCSMDNWGPQAEFARSGMDLKQWEQNFDTLLNHSKVIISIHSTISPITLCTMGDLYSRIKDWNKVREIKFGWNTIAAPSFMNPEILGRHAIKFFDEVLETLPDNDSRKEYFKGFKKQVTESQVDPKRLLKLKNYLNNIDIRRNTDWKSLYPWLSNTIDQELKKINTINDSEAEDQLHMLNVLETLRDVPKENEN